MIGKIISPNIYSKIHNNKNNKQKTYAHPKALAFDSVSFSNTSKKNINFTGGYFKSPTMDATRGKTEIDWEPQHLGLVVIANKDRLKILQADQQELQYIAECLYTLGEPDIRNYCIQWKNNLLGEPTEVLDGTKKAFAKLMPEIQKVRQKVEELTAIKERLETKKITETIDLTEQKRMLSIEFLRAADLNDKGFNVDVPNGILLYGNCKTNRDAMFEWIKEKSNFTVKEVPYNPQDPDGSIRNLIQTLEDAQFIYEASGVRTLIDLSGFDELLTSYKTREARRVIARFKNLAEVAAKKYHATLVLQTGYPVKSLEPAATGAQRFNIAFNLSKIDLTPEEEDELARVSTELDRISENAKDKGWQFRAGYSTVPYEEEIDAIREYY